MQITFIGTGSGKTNLKRFHTSILTRTSNHSLLIDSGDGTARALMNLSININDIDSILFTHYHADHFSGITSLLTQMKLSKRQKPLNIFTHTSLVQNIKSFFRMCYIFVETTEFEINISGFGTDEEITIADNLKFIAKQNSHIANKYNISDQEGISFVSFSLRIDGENKSFVYTSDVGCEDDIGLFNDQPADIFISEITHVTPEQVYSSFKKSSAGELYLTHIDDDDEEQIVNWISSKPDSEKIILTQDGLTIKL